MLNKLLSKLGKLDLSNPRLKDVVKGSAFGLLIKLSSATSLFLMNLIAAQKLGPHEAGLFFLSITLVMFFSAIGRMGLDNTLLRFVASENAKGNFHSLAAVYNKSILWAFSASVIIAIILLLLNHTLSTYIFIQVGFESVFYIFIVSIPLLSLYMLNAQALLGLKRVVSGLSIQNFILPLLLLLSFLPIYHLTARIGAFLYLFFSFIVLVLSLYWWKRARPTTSLIGTFPTITLWSSCKQLWLVTVLNQIILWSSQIILGVTDSAENVAFFSAAQRTSMLISLILIAINSITAPKFSEMYSSGDLAGLKSVAQLSTKLMLIFSAPIFVVMLFLPDWLLNYFGPEFIVAAQSLSIMAIGQFINVATGSVGYLLSMTGHEKELRINSMLSAIIGLGLAVLLIPRLGILGAALSTAMATASQNLLGVYQVYRIFGFNTLFYWR